MSIINNNVPYAHEQNLELIPEDPVAENEQQAIAEGYSIGNIVQSTHKVFNASPMPINNKGNARSALEALKTTKKIKKPPIKQNAPPTKPAPLDPLPSSLRVELWQFGEIVDKEKEAEKKYLTNFTEEEKHFLKKQLGRMGQHFTTSEEYHEAEKLRKPFDQRILANDPAPASKQVVQYLKDEIDCLKQEIESLRKSLASLTNKLTSYTNELETAKKKARRNKLNGWIGESKDQIEMQKQQISLKEELLAKKQKRLLQIESQCDRPWSPLTQLKKDTDRKNALYSPLMDDGEEQRTAQLKKIGVCRTHLHDIKRNIGREIEADIVKKIRHAAIQLAELAQELKNDSATLEIEKIISELSRKSIGPQEALKELGKLLSQIYKHHFLKGREAPRPYKDRKDKDTILATFKATFGEKRFKEVSEQLQSFLQETVVITQPLEIVKQENTTEALNGIDLTECKVSELQFYHGTLLESENETIELSKMSHTLPVDSYLKNRLPYAIIHLLHVDSSSYFAQLFPNQKAGATQVRFFFGTMSQAISYYCPNSITKVSGGGSEFYLFETYQDHTVEVIGGQKKGEKQNTRFYNYHILIFDVPSIESLEHQLYQLRYAGIPVQDMVVKGDLETFNDQQVNALAQSAVRYLDNADKTYGTAIRVLFLGTTGRLLKTMGQYLQPGLGAGQALDALKIEYITPGNPIFNLHHTRISIFNPEGKPIPVALLALRMPNGSLAGKATYAMLTEAKVEYLVTVGAGGSINYKTPIGKYEFIHRSMVYEQRKLIQVDLTQAYTEGRVLIHPNAQATANITVSGPLLETGSWLNEIKAVDPYTANCDVESFYIIDAFNRAGNELTRRKRALPSISPVIFISDHVGKKDSSLEKIIGKEAYKDSLLLVQFVTQQIRELEAPFLIPNSLPSSFGFEQYDFTAKTIYAPPGEPARQVTIPIAVIRIPLKKAKLGQIFSFINAATINRPFDKERKTAIEEPYTSSRTELTAHRPNHNGTHGARQARLVEAVFPLIENFGSRPMQNVLWDLSEEDMLAIELAAYCLRAGRCDESGWKLDGDDYNSRSAEIFIQYASQLGIWEETIVWLAERIRYSTFDDDNAKIKDDYDRFGHAVLSLAHELDLVRIFPADKFKNKVHKHLKTLLWEKVEIEPHANTLIKFSQDLSIATGGTLGHAKAPLQQEAKFTICSTYGSYCWDVVKSVPIPKSLLTKTKKNAKKENLSLSLAIPKNVKPIINQPLTLSTTQLSNPVYTPKPRQNKPIIPTKK